MNTAAVRRINAGMAVVWAVMVPVAYFAGWLESIVFVSAASIYANAATHLAASRADSKE